MSEHFCAVLNNLRGTFFLFFSGNPHRLLPLSQGFVLRPPSTAQSDTMAAAPPQIVTVDSPAGAPTSDCPIFLDANSEVVSSTPCLDWQPAPAGPGGAARVQLQTFQAVKAFLPRCKFSRTAADLAAANAVNVLTLRLQDAGWSRVLTELTDRA